MGEDMDMEDTDMEVMVDTVMERDLLMLSPVMDMELVMVLPPLLTIHMEVPAPPTEAPRDFLDMAMVLTDMEREMLSLVMDTELVTVLPPLLTIHMEVPALPTEAPRDFLDTAMEVPTAASMSQDLTPTMALMLPTLTKKTVRDRKMYLQTNVASIHLMYLLNRFK